MFVNHCHVGPEGCFDKNNPETGTLKKLKRIMDKAGIKKAVAFAPFVRLMDYDESWYHCPLKTDRECNEWLYQALKDYPGISGFATVSPKNPAARKILTEYVEKGFVGVKMHPAIFRVKLDDPALKKYYDTIEALKVPVLVHTGVHGWYADQYMPILLDRVAYAHPNLNIIIEHCGMPCFFDQALAVFLNHSKIRNRHNVFAGITGQLKPENREKLLTVIKALGADHLIYGLDYPFHDEKCLKKDIEFIKNNLGLKTEEKEAVLGKNLEGLTKR